MTTSRGGQSASPASAKRREEDTVLEALNIDLEGINDGAVQAGGAREIGKSVSPGHLNSTPLHKRRALPEPMLKRKAVPVLRVAERQRMGGGRRRLPARALASDIERREPGGGKREHRRAARRHDPSDTQRTVPRRCGACRCPCWRRYRGRTGGAAPAAAVGGAPSDDTGVRDGGGKAGSGREQGVRRRRGLRKMRAEAGASVRTGDRGGSRWGPAAGLASGADGGRAEGW